MAAAQGLSQHHECALCMESFTSPRLLPCFHTFCVGCLKRLVHSQRRSGTFPCPSCRTTITIPPGGVEKFQVNFYIEAEGQDAGSSAGVRACEMCRNNPASHKCTDCDQLSCDTCTAIHASIAAARSHTVLQLKKDKGGHSAIKVTKERYCATHKEEKIRFFCNQCSTVICRDCKLTSHEGHATTDLSAKSSEAKQLILKVTKRSRKNLEPKLRQQLREAGDHQKNMKNKKKEILAMLEKRAGELKQEIDRSLSQAKQQLDQETASLDKTIATCIDSMDMELAGFLSLTEHAERIVNGGCEADILEMPRQMKDFFQVELESTIDAELQSQRYFPRQLSQARAANTPPCKSVCKLRSFTDSKWKAAVQMEDDMTQCWNCSCRHDKKLQYCPECRQASNTQSGYNSYYGNHTENKQCKSCRQMYVGHLQNCPSCGAAAEDAKAAVQRAIPEYIGRVTRIEAEEEDSNAHLNYQRNWGGNFESWHPVKETKNILASQIIKEINAIQSCLSQWKGEKKVE